MTNVMTSMHSADRIIFQSVSYTIFFVSPFPGAIKGEGLSDVVCVVVRYFGTFQR